MQFVKIILCYCFLIGNIGLAIAYKAGALHSSNDVFAQIQHAKGKDLDIIVLPEIQESEKNYDEIVKSLSKAAKSVNSYVVANLRENVRCQNKMESVRSTLVFDRNGGVITEKPVSQVANCTSPTEGLTTFITDFGVKFALMMEDDVVLQQNDGGLKNFLVGDWKTDLNVYSGPHYLASWSYVNNVNVISSRGIYPGLGSDFNGITVVELQDNGEDISTDLPVTESSINQIEDLSLYTVRPLDLQASVKGYRETICHEGFCCEFYIKTGLNDVKDSSYGLGVFNGVRHYSGNQYLGEQNCGVYACAGVYKKPCDLVSTNQITFEKLSINANFTKSSSQYPIILAKSSANAQFSVDTDSDVKHATVKVTDAVNAMTFALYGRVYERDYVNVIQNEDGLCDYLFNENVQVFFDYLWVRIRVLLFVVSIYVLEMM